jgi:hypothetical protein
LAIGPDSQRHVFASRPSPALGAENADNSKPGNHIPTGGFTIAGSNFFLSLGS